MTTFLAGSRDEQQAPNLETLQPTTPDTAALDRAPLSSQDSTHASKSPLEEDPEEQALESHEVIELQTFSERKAWIEEKIKVCSSFSLFFAMCS